MAQYIGLDVSVKETHICVVDGGGEVLARGREATQPELPAAAIGKLAPHARVAVLETGGQSSWLHRELTARGVPAVIADARRAKAALSCRMNKTDATGSGETRSLCCAPNGETNAPQGHWDARTFSSHHAAGQQDRPIRTAQTTLKPAAAKTRSLTKGTAIRGHPRIWGKLRAHLQ